MNIDEKVLKEIILEVVSEMGGNTEQKSAPAPAPKVEARHPDDAES